MSDGKLIWLNTRQCAARLGMSTDFVVGEIHDKRLQAHVIVRNGKRVVYRIAVADFETYLHRHHGRAEHIAK